MEFEFLKSLVIIFGVSALVVFLLNRLKIPSIVGFLIAGVIIGPHGLGLVKDVHDVELLAEIGVILLLFVIGIEFSLSNLMRMKKAVIGGGGAQVALTILLSAGAAYLVTGNTNRSVFFGFLVALSSTAIVLKMLSERAETDSPHGRMMVGILIFQDLCVVPLMFLIPAMGGEGISIPVLAIKMGKAALLVAAILLLARWIVPGLLHQVVHTRSRELFITTIILLCLGIALLTSKFGLSLALGAFLAGLVVSESEYAHQATSEILPFKDSFIGLFFVSVGMLMDIGFMSDNCLVIAMAVTAIFGLKTITGMLSAIVIGSPLRTALHTGLGLAQIGEFSFVLAVAGKAVGLITEDFYQIFLSSSVATMIMTPFVLKSAPTVSGWITSRSLLKRASRMRKISEGQAFPRKKSGHVIIVGFGLNGRNLARVLKRADIPYVVLELNSGAVREMKKKGEPIYYGDGTSTGIMQKLGISRARLLVIAISDPTSTRRMVDIARKENPDLYIIVRTRYLAEVDDLKALGANEVIPEEFETSIEIFSRVLHQYQFPRNVITEHIERIRSDSYEVLRKVEIPKKHLVESEMLAGIETETFLIKEGSHVAGHSIRDLHLRSETGATIIAVEREDKIHQNPEPGFILKPNDIILLIGKKEDINHAIEFLESDRFIVWKYHR